MSKLARQIILSITYAVLMVLLVTIMSPLCLNTAGEIINKAGYITCLVFECIFSIVMVIGTFFIWIRKNVPDITVGKRG